MNLSELEIGKTANITGLDIDGGMRRRLQDIGFVSGSCIKHIGTSPLGDPAAYLIKGAVIALRYNDARKIYITPGR